MTIKKNQQDNKNIIMVINNMMTSISTRQYVNIEQNYLLYIIFGDEIYLLVDLYDIQNNKERKG